MGTIYPKLNEFTHHVMTTSLLLNGSHLEVLIGQCQVSSHLLQSLLRDSVDAKLLLAYSSKISNEFRQEATKKTSSLTLGQPKPELSPGGVTVALGEQLLGLLAGISAIEGRLVRVKSGHFEICVCGNFEDIHALHNEGKKLRYKIVTLRK